MIQPNVTRNVIQNVYPKLTSDEALCQYGGGGNARGEACKRVRAEGGVLPTVKKEKSLGGAYAM
jgi:hypothetical protein